MAKTPKRPRDPAQLAKLVVDIAVGEANQEADAPQNSTYEFARQGGLKGGKARASSLTPEQRREIAKNAAKKRWKPNS